MVTKTDIDCAGYKVEIETHHPDRLGAALVLADAAGLTGEARVAAVTSMPGTVFLLRRTKGGKLNDGPGGLPAFEIYEGKGGTLSALGHYKDGVRTDGIHGEAAQQSYKNGGTRAVIKHYKEGKLNNAASGAAAVEAYKVTQPMPRMGGNLLDPSDLTLLQKEYRVGGELQDTADGLPALRRFSEAGWLVLREYYAGGQLQDSRFGEPAHKEYLPNGKLVATGHYARGQLQDPASGAAAYTKISRDGTTLKTLHARAGRLAEGADGSPAARVADIASGVDVLVRHVNEKGQLNDAPDGSPALREFNAKSGAWTVSRYQDGLLSDNAKGAAALCAFDAAGHVSLIEHWRNGSLRNGADGAPARMVFDAAGKLTQAESIGKNGKVRKLGAIARRRAGKKFGNTKA